MLNPITNKFTANGPTPEVYKATIAVLMATGQTPVTAAVGCVLQILRAVHSFPEGQEVSLRENSGQLAGERRNTWTRFSGGGQRPLVGVQAYLTFRGARPWVGAFLSLARAQYDAVKLHADLTDEQTGIAMFMGPGAVRAADIRGASDDVLEMVGRGLVSCLV
jgi:hypothetical protein